MSEIERLCEVLLNALHSCGDQRAYVDDDFDGYAVVDGDISPEGVVRAVLTAMREPSDDTIRAGFKGWMSLTELDPGDVWQAMIDHILNQEAA